MSQEVLRTAADIALTPRFSVNIYKGRSQPFMSHMYIVYRHCIQALSQQHQNRTNLSWMNQVTIFSLLNPAISNSLSPISIRTSSVCSPSNGGARRMLGSAFEYFTGGEITLICPHAGCAIVWTMPRACTASTTLSELRKNIQYTRLRVNR